MVVGVQEMKPETVSEDKDAEYKLVCTHTAKPSCANSLLVRDFSVINI